ncbi:PKD domain-containing protein [Corynebacterium sp. CCM 9204]|uniref:PKD domain-containing protein n=1 Tax=Corynebacterium sp. CCM 9204 TaxID=3057616 RepID=UPI0035264898
MSRSRVIRSVCAVLVAWGMVGAGSPAVAGTVSDPVVPFCPDPMVLAARGSGVGNTGSREYPGAAGPSTGWEGTGISRLLERADLHGFTVSALDLDEYPAVEAWRFDELLESVERGRRSVVRRVGDLQRSGCQPVVIPAGYSQGAMVLNAAEHALSNSVYLPGVFYLGNPLRDGQSPRAVGSAPLLPGRAVLSQTPWEAPVPGLSVPGQDGIDYCYRNDIFCDPGGLSVQTHLSYFTDLPGEASADRAVVDAFSDWTAQAQERISGAGRASVTRPVEGVLILDTEDPVVLADLARGASRIVREVSDSHPDARIGIAVRRDGEVRWLVSPTRDTSELLSALLHPSGLLTGDSVAVSAPDSKLVREMITVGDATVSVGERTFSYSSAGVSGAVLAAFETIAMAPNAVLDAPGIWFSGRTAGLTGMLSRVFTGGPVRQYLDFGDGTGAVIPADDYVEHVWQRPGTYEVTLTVTDSAGRTGTDRRWVRVYPGDGVELSARVGSSSGSA